MYGFELLTSPRIPQPRERWLGVQCQEKTTVGSQASAGASFFGSSIVDQGNIGSSYASSNANQFYLLLTIVTTSFC